MNRLDIASPSFRIINNKKVITIPSFSWYVETFLIESNKLLFLSPLFFLFKMKIYQERRNDRRNCWPI